MILGYATKRKQFQETLQMQQVLKESVPLALEVQGNQVGQTGTEWEATLDFHTL